MASKRRFTPGLIVALAIAVVLAPLCIVSANDRVAGNDLPFAGLGSIDVGPNVNLPSAWFALSKNSPDADRLALAALTGDPLNQTALDILEGSAEKHNDAVRADAVYRVSAGLGWRDPATQRYWFEAAIGDHDYVQAAKHLDAMFRVGAIDSGAAEEISTLEQTPGGREAWVTQMRLQPFWIGPYIVGSANVTGQQWPARLATLELARRNGAILPQDMLGYLSSQLLRAGDILQAYQVWTNFGGGVLPPAGSLLIANGDFQRAVSSTSTMPFDWHVSSNSAAIAAAGAGFAGISGQALRVDIDSYPDNPIATIWLALKAGVYEIGWSISAAGDNENAQVIPKVQCGASHETMSAKTAPDGTAQNPRFVFVVPPGNTCLFQSLALNALPETMGTRTVWLDNVTISPLATEPVVTAPAPPAPMIRLRPLRINLRTRSRSH